MDYKKCCNQEIKEVLCEIEKVVDWFYNQDLDGKEIVTETFCRDGAEFMTICVKEKICDCCCCG